MKLTLLAYHSCSAVFGIEVGLVVGGVAVGAGGGQGQGRRHYRGQRSA